MRLFIKYKVNEECCFDRFAQVAFKKGNTRIKIVPKIPSMSSPRSHFSSPFVPLYTLEGLKTILAQESKRNLSVLRILVLKSLKLGRLKLDY
jgi:hypothetical protein